MELALDEERKGNSIGRMERFQSLFSWNLLLMAPQCGQYRARQQLVSILVFVELALDGRHLSGQVPHPPVSILVFVELALDVCAM